MESLRLFIRLARPHFLLGGVLLYALGAGIAHYLGNPLDVNVYFLGQAWVTLLQLGTQFLNEYYDGPQDTDNPNRTSFSGGSGAVGPGKLTRNTALVAAGACLTVVASLTVLLIGQGRLAPAAGAIMLVAFLGAFFYSAPPVRLSASGYGEITTSILVANLVPAFAFILQTGELHRLVAMATFPLTALHIAMMLAFELPDYAADLKHQKRTMLIRLDWPNGMLVHNLMVLGGYLLLALAMLYGLPFRIALPAFLTLPLGLYQIWQMRRLADGARPNWSALTWGAVALFALTAYLLAFAFWTR